MTGRLAILAFCVGMAALPPAADGAGWRSDGTGVYPDATPPVTWAPDQGVVWATPIPKWSNASPVLQGDRLFVCAEPDTLLCVTRTDGAIAWQAANAYEDLQPPVADSKPPPAHNDNGYSSATPVTDGWSVAAVFGSGVVACYTVDGKLLWRRLVEKPTQGWGHSSSPVIADGKLIVHIRKIHAFDLASGEPLWVADAPERWGSPVVARVGETDVVITPSGSFIRASDGKSLATNVADLQYNAPVVHGSVVYFVQHGGKAIQLPDAVAEPLELKTLWTTKPRNDRYYASPIVADGLIYALTRNNVFSVIDATNGEIVYSQSVDLGSGDAFPSVTLAGGRLYVSNSNGTTLVLKPGRQYEEVAKNKLERFRSSPVFAGARMYIRGLAHLYCIGE